MPMTSRRTPNWLVVVAAAYLLGALGVGLWPRPVDSGMHPEIFSALAFLHRIGLPQGFGYNALEFTANVGFFVPIGLLLAMLLRPRRFYLAILGGAMLSGSIELSQLVFLPARYASWKDIEANTLGTVIGVLAVVIARGIWMNLRARSDINPANPATPATR